MYTLKRVRLNYSEGHVSLEHGTLNVKLSEICCRVGPLASGVYARGRHRVGIFCAWYMYNRARPTTTHYASHNCQGKVPLHVAPLKKIWSGLNKQEGRVPLCDWPTAPERRSRACEALGAAARRSPSNDCLVLQLNRGQSWKAQLTRMLTCALSLGADGSMHEGKYLQYMDCTTFTTKGDVMLYLVIKMDRKRCSVCTSGAGITEWHTWTQQLRLAQLLGVKGTNGEIGTCECLL